MSPTLIDSREGSARPGMTVYDEFGAWTLERDRHDNWIAVQGQTEVLLLDAADFRRFDIIKPTSA